MPKLKRWAAWVVSASLLTACTAADSSSRPWLHGPEPSVEQADLARLSSAVERVMDSWPLSSLEAEGIDPVPIARLVKRIESGSYRGIDSLLLARNGKLVNEHYFGDYDLWAKHQTRSTFKSVAGLVAGIAISEGRLQLDEPIVPLIARYQEPGDRDQRKRRITVRHLLQMTSGLDCSEMPGTGPYRESKANKSPDDLAAHLDVPMAGEPGKSWRYCSTNAFLLGTALESALARDGLGSLKAYLDARLMDPLGIFYDPAYTTRGHLSMQGGERMRPRDFAKLGQLLVSGGGWRGRQVIPSGWIAAILSDGTETDWSWTRSVAPDPPLQRLSSYRYLWFRTVMRVAARDYQLVHSWGNGGQFIIAVPELDLVVVTTGSNYGGGKIEEQAQIFHMLQRYILPAVERQAAG